MEDCERGGTSEASPLPIRALWKWVKRESGVDEEEEWKRIEVGQEEECKRVQRGSIRRGIRVAWRGGVVDVI